MSKKFSKHQPKTYRRTPGGWYHCEECNITFYTAKSIKAHQKREHK